MVIGQQVAPAVIQTSRPAQTPSSPVVTEPTDTVVPAEHHTPGYVKAGKVALLLAATAGAGALGHYAGTGNSATNVIAGVVTGALTGATALGTVGLLGDVAGGIMGGSNNTPKAAALGAVVGAVAGGFASGHPIAGFVLAGTAGLATAAITGAATNILAK